MIEEKENMTMVSPTAGDPFRKKAYFLKPVVPSSSIDEPPFELPQSFSSLPSRLDPKDWPLRIRYQGWRIGHEDLQTWADHLAPFHQSTWKKAGIYEAIFNSTYQIKRKVDLVCGLAERWCSETNTFIFPWGEATITLEDVMVLGGYSVLGESVFSPLESRELKEIEETLNKQRAGAGAGAGSTYVTGKMWLNKFMKSGSRFEHEAFLVFWLSRYVFFKDFDSVKKAVIPIAIRLARGTRISLAPAVLASIYRDLSLLKNTIVALSELKTRDEAMTQLKLDSPFHLLPVWAYERFLELRPKPNVIRSGEPRLARWDNVEGVEVENLRSVLDSAGEGFMWRPYAIAIENWEFPKYYVEKEDWVWVGPGLNDDELLSFFIYLRASVLVGLGTKQQYLPHRVAMQFGYDQDIPCFVAPLNHSSDITWKPYLKELENVRLYIPSRLSEGDVSTRYLKWWKESMTNHNHRIMPLKERAKRSVEEETHEINDTATPRNLENLMHLSTGRNQGIDSLVPSGFTPKWRRLEAGDPMDEDDHLTISEVLKKSKKQMIIVETGKGSDSGNLSVLDHSFADSIADESLVNTKMPERLLEGIVFIWGAKGKRKRRNVMRLLRQHQNVETRKVSNSENLSARDQYVATSVPDECSVSTMMPLIWGCKGKRKRRNVTMLKSRGPNEDIVSVNDKECGSNGPLFENRGDCVSSTFAFGKQVADLKSRIIMLEKIVEVLKEGAFGQKFTEG